MADDFSAESSSWALDTHGRLSPPKNACQDARREKLAVTGRVDVAIKLAENVTRNERPQKVFGFASLVDALTSHADALKSVGMLLLAENIANRAVRLSFYSDPSQAAYAKWKLGEVLAANSMVLEVQGHVHEQQRVGVA